MTDVFFFWFHLLPLQSVQQDCDVELIPFYKPVLAHCTSAVLILASLPRGKARPLQVKQREMEGWSARERNINRRRTSAMRQWRLWCAAWKIPLIPAGTAGRHWSAQLALISAPRKESCKTMKSGTVSWVCADSNISGTPHTHTPSPGPLHTHQCHQVFLAHSCSVSLMWNTQQGFSNCESMLEEKELHSDALIDWVSDWLNL